MAPGMAMRFWLANLFLALVVVALGAARAGHNVVTKVENPTGPGWLAGNLTWDGSRGGIVWGPAVSSGPGGHGQTGKPPAPDNFSTVLDAPLYFNAASRVQVDLLFQGATASCSTTTVRLYSNQKLVGGDMESVLGAWPARPEVPSGYYRCVFVFALEQSIYAAHSTLTLELRYSSDTTHKIGVSEEAPSMIRIPIFLPEEAPYRFPQIFPKQVGAEETGRSTSLLGVLGAAGALAAPEFSRGGRKTKMVVVVALLLAGLGGCLGSQRPSPPLDDDAATDTGSVDIGIHDATDSRVAGGPNGSIIGQAGDRYLFPIRNAFVVLLGTSRSATTNDYGLFSLRELEPRTYRLRIDAQDFVSREFEAKVFPGKITKIDVVLAFDESKSIGERPHRHDYWGGADEKILWSGELSASCASTTDCISFASHQFTVPPTDDAGHNVIIPGTVEVEVTLEFAETPSQPAVALVYQDNTDTGQYNGTPLLPRGSNESFRIQTAWETTDSGHQLFSTWIFGVSFSGHDWSSGPKIRSATFKIIRGNIPLEPAHPDHWKGRDALELVRNRIVSDSPTDLFVAVPVTYYSTLCVADPTLGPLPLINRDAYTGDVVPSLGGPDSVVPAETRRLDVYVNLSRANGPAGITPTFDWELWYKNGEKPPQEYVPEGSVYVPAPRPTVSTNGQEWHWTISLKDQDPDGLYNRKSAWRFVLVPSNWQARCLDVAANAALSPYAAPSNLQRFAVEVSATR